MPQNSYKHIALFSLEAWGHTRPACTFVSKLVRLRPVYVTFFVGPMLYDKVQAEMSRCFGPEDMHFRNLVRVVELYIEESQNLSERWEQDAVASIAAFGELADENPVTCAHTHKRTEPLSSPDMVIVDMIMGPVADAVRSLSKKPVKVYSWYTLPTSAGLWHIGPTRLGGKGDPRSKVYEEMERSGRPLAEVAEEIISGFSDSLRQVPGLPPMYDYEAHPQEPILPGINGRVLMSIMNCIAKCDGMICSTPEVLEPEGYAGLRDWLAELGQSVYAIGPLLPEPSKENAIAGENQQSADGSAIEAFLDKILRTHGEKSLLYISFGTIFWSKQPQTVWAFLDVVMEKNIPFIMTHASPFALVPEEVISKVQNYGFGLLSKWAPQQTVLSHPATGWFLSHCGQNSCIEAVTEGIPLICWPFQADQGTNAVHITENLAIGYELFEVRSGHGLRPIHRLRGRTPTVTIEAVREEASMTLEKAFGEDGKKKRANVEKLRLSLLGAWEEDGPATRELRDLVHELDGSCSVGE